MIPGGAALDAALDSVLDGQDGLDREVDRLMAAYRSHEVPRAPILASARDVAAYAAYRMPATYGATYAALAAARAVLPGLRPRTLVDAGAGTGAASWAAAEVFDPAGVTLLERSPDAIAFGRALATHSRSAAVRGADWHPWSAGDPLPAADLLVAAYLLGELPDGVRDAFVLAAADAAATVVLVEPGTPPGYARVVAARDLLLGAGLTIAAPCPHDATCPLLARGDWCHFAVRVTRSERHRRLKGARLDFEDEKLSYVVATREPVPSRPHARVLRHPVTRKGLVSLELCVDGGDAETRVVSKRHGDLYRAARKTAWGDAWDG